MDKDRSKKAESFIEHLTQFRSPNVFNPYGQFCRQDRGFNSPGLRRSLLMGMIDHAMERGVQDLWVGRDFGWRGGRRTGLAFTDDAHVEAHARRWFWSSGHFMHGAPLAEQTATVVWSVLSKIDLPIFLWNVFPFHPHQPGAPFTNRAHNQSERNAGLEILKTLVALLRPVRLVAVGRDAERAAALFDQPRVYVRHPSHGGARLFVEGISELYGLNPAAVLTAPHRNQGHLFKGD